MHRSRVAASAFVAAWLVLAATSAQARDDEGSTGTAQGGLTVAPSSGATKPRPGYFRLVLKDGTRYLDSNNCKTTLTLKAGHGVRGDRCELWRIVPVEGEWFRLVIEPTNRVLDACGKTVVLAPYAEPKRAACQTWRLAADRDGWSKLQVRAGGKLLDASYCKEVVAMHPGSDWANGACQRWRLVREQ